jgi:hypothetical protein
MKILPNKQQSYQAFRLSWSDEAFRISSYDDRDLSYPFFYKNDLLDWSAGWVLATWPKHIYADSAKEALHL